MLIDILYRLGIFTLLIKLNPNRLTVLNYHRVADHRNPKFDTFKPNVSATPDGFAEQMDFLKRYFNLVSIDEVTAWLDGKGVLPKYPALITFDDGYYDNLSNALPVLSQRKIPALIFLTIDFINRLSVPFWDNAACCFYRTRHQQAQLPLFGDREWGDAGERDRVIKEFVEAIKYLPKAQKNETLERLQETLEVSLHREEFSSLFLNWDQVRELNKAGISFGAHTVSHPILTRILLEEARQEISASKTFIEEQLGDPISSFAYPNGQAADFNAEIQTLVKDAGYRSAFTLVDGPNPLEQVKGAPYQINRIFIGHKDSLPRFAAKVSGVHRIVAAMRGR